MCYVCVQGGGGGQEGRGDEGDNIFSTFYGSEI